MSFSREVKEELENHHAKSEHCKVAESEGRKFFTLLDKTLNIEGDVADLDDTLLKKSCCKRAFIRGAFLAAGSISDPNKGYHFEVVAPTKSAATLLIREMNFFEVEAKAVKRGGRDVVYLKDGSQIVEILRVMEAPHSVMELESIRVVKEVRGTINRKVNCETANISKTVEAAFRQIEDINLIDKKIGLDNLPESLQTMAYVRLENPDTPLSELGDLIDPPIGKSGVNHRLKRLQALAATLKED